VLHCRFKFGTTFASFVMVCDRIRLLCGKRECMAHQGGDAVRSMGELRALQSMLWRSL